MSEQDVPKKSREKSPLYPAVTIKEAVEFLKQIDALGGKSVSYTSILSAMGLSSPTTRSFITRISASKQYGFITTGASTVQLTDFAKKILYPIDDSKQMEQKMLIEAFSKPPIYTKLIERFENKALPQKVQLSNILMNDYHIVKTVKDNAAECFIENAENLGVLLNGVLTLDINDSSKESYLEEQNDRIEQSSAETINNEEVYIASSMPSYYNFEIPTLNGKSVKIQIPEEITEKDLDYIALYIKQMLPVFIENLKEELEQKEE